MTRLGVLGGTFDPVHLGHVRLAEVALECAQLDEVILVPAGVPPHRGPALAAAADRLAMVELAVAARRRLRVSDVELRRAGPSYTIDTLSELAAAEPHAELYLVLGWDAARELRSWHRPADVLSRARVVIVGRPGLKLPSPADLDAAGLDRERTVVCPAATPPVAATDVRRRLASGASLHGLLDPAVEEYIKGHRLYQ